MNMFKTFSEVIVVEKKKRIWSHSQPLCNSLCNFPSEDPVGSSEVWFCGHIPV